MSNLGIKKQTLEKDFEIENNTLKRVVKSDIREKIELEIGDSKQLEAYPQAKIMKWDNEVNFSIRRDNKPRAWKEQAGMIVFENNEEDVRFYELDGFEDGGLEVEILLKNKPKNNVFDFSIETKGLDFFKQHELTEAEIEKGFTRVEEVVNSYAVYHKTKKNNNLNKEKDYKTGKFCHIYRPKSIDKTGNEVWCDLNIDINNKKLTVIVPQDFLNNAKYPIIIDPTFGYTTEGASSYLLSSSGYGVSYTDEESTTGALQSISAYLKSNGGERTYTFHLYSSSSSGVPQSSLANSSEGTTTTNNYVLKTANVSYTMSGSKYFISVYTGSGNLFVANDSGAGDDESYIFYPSIGNIETTNKFSIYGTYTLEKLSQGVQSIQGVNTITL